MSRSRAQRQLETIRTEFRDAQARLARLRETVPAERWPERPEPGRWSISECIDHLNRTGEAYVPVLRAAIADAEAMRGSGGGRFRRDGIGWLLSVIMPPPVRFSRSRTTAPFEPVATDAPDALVRRFDELQREQVECLEAADGLPLDRIRIASPFNPRVHYNLYSCFVILPRHQHRHLWQAEQVAARLGVAT